ncbi:MAG: GNAT family N-acetyltransferase [Bacteroidales bacterium]|nr:GNAT family N-acetyltransferase [Bacteroidales bacterium]
MNYQNQNKLIFNNLSNFYRAINSSPITLNYSDFFLTSRKDYVWPKLLISNNVFGKNNLRELENLSKAARENNALIVLTEKHLPTDKNILKQCDLIPVAQWKGMILELTENIENNPINCFTVEKVKTESDLKTWFKIVNNEVLKKKTLEYEVFKDCLKNKQFSFYLGREAADPVATSLTYTTETETGLYFISTDNKQRGKGFGTKMTKFAINKAFIAGQTRFVLHATKSGEKIYQKLGFIEKLKIYLFASTKTNNNGQEYDTRAGN